MGEWTQCSSTCDTGIHRRYRQCEDGSICLGDYIETTACESSPCPVYGKWSAWSSWSSCTVSCGGGKQVRDRFCNKTNTIECVGVPMQEKTCSNWKCPDCFQMCTDGRLNQACDTCKCENIVITGRVLAQSTGNFLSDASFFVASAPTTAIGQSNLTGFFALNSTCLTSDLIVVRDGFIDTHVTVNDQEVDIYMDKIVLPSFTETPQSKQRLTGENVTLCCDASANPDIEYYEWFKDSIVLDSSLYQNGKELTLHNITLHSSGTFQCRANSPAGAILTTAATLTVKDRMDDFCVGALSQKVIALPEDCVLANTNTSTYEVGECIPKRCRAINPNDTAACREDAPSCCSIKDAVLKTLHCIDYDVQVFVVTSCGCSICPSNSLKIDGRAVGLVDNSPVKYGEVRVNGVFKTYTSFSGDFNFIHVKTSNKITITVEDNFYKDFLSGFKILELSDEMGGTLYVEIKMITPTEPIEIDPTQENILSAGSAENNSSKIQISIPPNAFYHPNGTVFNGNVMASLTFLDPTNVSTLESIPGDFKIVDEEGEDGKLESLGVFNMYFSDSSGQPLVLNDVVDMFIPLSLGDEEFYQEFKLWRLSSSTGYWEYVQPSTTARRKKRRTNTAVWIGDIDWSSVQNQEWFNYDKIYRISNSPCYFKLKLYQDETMLSYQTINTLVQIQTHYMNNNVLTTITNTLSSRDDPDIYCASVICENESAYTSLFYIDRGFTHVYALAPYMDAQQPLEYSIDDSETTLKIKMTKSVDGPFFDNEITCRTANTNGFHLRYHFGHSRSFRPIEFFNAPVPTGFSVSTLQNIRMRSLSAWYPLRDNSYTVCFTKVRVVFAPNTASLDGLNMKLTVTSAGGTDSQILGKVFGVEQVDILNPLADASYCIEYKCSGKIPEFLVRDHYDYSKIKIKLHYPKDDIKCTVTQESSDLSTSFNIASSSSLFGDYSNKEQLNSIGGIYYFFDPTEFGPNYGTYKSTSDNLDVPSAKIIAENECKSGEIQNYNEEVDNRGVAVTFNCGET